MKKNQVDEYIESFPEEVRTRLERIRVLGKEVFQGAEEKISYGMPTFRGKKNLFHYAAFKHHIGIFPGSEGVAHFKERLDQEKYPNSKGGFQISNDRPLDEELIQSIQRWCKENHDA
ncbi:iron chaperone [Guggenheimella bovis]